MTIRAVLVTPPSGPSYTIGAVRSEALGSGACYYFPAGARVPAGSIIQDDEAGLSRVESGGETTATGAQVFRVVPVWA